MITKVIFPDAYDFGQPAVSLVGFSTKGMEKRAALFDQDVPNIQKKANRAYLHVITTGAGERYGCVGPDTLIALPDGSFKAVADIAVGDTVLSGEGNDRAVLNVFQRDIDEAIELEVEGLPHPVIVSDNHPVEVVRKERFTCTHDAHKRCFPDSVGTRHICGRPQSSECVGTFQTSILSERVTADSLRYGDFLIFRHPRTAAPREISSAEAELMGYWLAEGCYVKNAGNGQATALRLSFNLKTEEFLVDYVITLAERIGMRGNKYASPSRGEWVVTISGNPEKVREWRGFFGDGAHEKRVPVWLLSLPTDTRIKLLRAYIEGDGSVDLASKQVYAHTASYALSVGVQRLLWSVGVAASVCALGAGGYHVCYRARHAPDDLRFGIEREARHKIRIFTHEGVTYLPIRKSARIEWGKAIYNMEVEGDHSYVSAGFYSHNCNANGDHFNETSRMDVCPMPKEASLKEIQLDGGLMKYHDDTYKKYGGVYHNHKNKHTKTASSGEIVLAKYNEPMHRGELLIGVDEKDWAPQLQKLANGKPVYLSMASDVPFDFCSYCHHIRKVADDKCEHVKNQLLMMTKEGHQVHLINDRPMFHDISEVFKPADKIAFTLRKVASQGVRSSDEIASEMGIPGLILPLEIQKKANGGKPGALARRLELLCKLAKIEKTIEAKINPGDEAAKLAFSPEGGFGDIDDKTVDQLREKDPSAVFGAAQRGMVLLPVDVFLKLLTGDRFGSDIAPMMPSVRASMGGVFGRMADSGSSCCDDAAYEPENVPDRGLEDIVGGLMGSHSLAPEPTRVRVIKVVMRKKPDAPAAMPKEAVSKLRTAASDYLAGEYAKYALAFLDGMPEDKARLTVAYTTGYSQV